MNTENEKFEYGLAHDDSDEQKITGLNQLSDPLPFVIADPEPKKRKPILLLATSAGLGMSAIGTAINSVLENDSRGIIITNVEDVKEVEKSTLEKLNDTPYIISKLPELEPIYLAKPINKKKNWYEGKHKKHRK